MTEYEDFFTLEQLRERGWHFGTIRRMFRSGPTKVVYPPPQNKKVELYRRDIVFQMEADPSFERVQRETREDSKRRVSDQISEIRETVIEIRRVSEAVLREDALHYYNSRRHRDIHGTPLIPPPGFWEKIIVDYLLAAHGERLEMTTYARSNRPIQKIEEIATEKILRAIIPVYPFLEGECRARLLTLRPATGKPTKGVESDSREK